MVTKDYWYDKSGKIEVVNYSVPMLHDDWHDAEGKGLIYIGYQHNGPDYWDDCMSFVKPEDVVRAEQIHNNSW